VYVVARRRRKETDNEGMGAQRRHRQIRCNQIEHLRPHSAKLRGRGRNIPARVAAAHRNPLLSLRSRISVGAMTMTRERDEEDIHL
jgi:hypothetical protein